MLDTTERFLEKNATLLSEEEMALTRQHMQALKDAIQAQDKNRIQQATEALNEVSRPFAERLMDAALKQAMRGTKVV